VVHYLRILWHCICQCFHGGADVTEAENWLLSTEKHLRSMGCAEMQKVQVGTFLLRGDAEH